MRLFVAIPLADPVVATFEQLQGNLPAGRALAPENLHLTLAFLDEQPQAVAADLHDALTALSHGRFDLTFSGLDTFGGNYPKLLMARAAPSDPLTQLHKSVCKAVRAVGISLRRETFRPHVTLARFSRHTPPRDMQRLGEFLAANAGFNLPSFTVERFCLYRSTLLPAGARHDVLANYPLI